MDQGRLGIALAAGAAGVALGLLAARLRAPFPRESARAFQKHGLSVWRPEQKQAAPFDTSKIVSFHTASCNSSVLYPLIISAVVPRPVAFISTLSKDGVGNLSPYSYFNAVSHSPPVLAIGHCWAKGAPKDSLRNILDTKELVVCIVSEWFVEAANHCCGPYDPKLNEMELSKLTPVESLKVKPPRVAESAVNMECTLLHHYDLKDGSGQVTNTVVLAQIQYIHVAQAVAAKTPRSGKTVVDPEKLKAVCRLGGNTYGVGPTLFDIPRPDKDGNYPGTDGFVGSERDKLVGHKL